jgi:hypothetical protein
MDACGAKKSSLEVMLLSLTFLLTAKLVTAYSSILVILQLRDK